MSHCVVPNWNLRHQRQQEEVEGEEGNRSSHVHNHLQNPIHMSNYEVAELTWENGQLAMHELGGLLPTTPIKPTWNRAGDTLESIVHQATCQNPNNMNSLQHDQNPANLCSINVASSCGGGAAGRSSRVPTGTDFVRKRTRTETDQCGRNFSSSVQEERLDRSVCASASATFCRDKDTTRMTWTSFESPHSLKTRTADDDSACHGGSENRDEDRDTKFETGRSHTMRRTRAADIHNQSERRRRDRINQKMKALQKLVPNSSKTDKASMLDEVIDYLKQLQAQIQMMNAIRNIPQMMLPIGIHQQQQQQQQQQHQLQMSLLARMAGMGAVGLGMGMGMLDMNSMVARTAPLIHPSVAAAAAATPTFVPAPFVMPPMIPMRTLTPQPNSVPASSAASVPMHDPYSALLAQQTMNLDLYNKMAALYRQQVSQTTQPATTPSQSKHHGQRN